MRAPAFWRDDCALSRLLSPLGAIYGRFAGERLSREAPRAPLLAIVVGGLTTGGDGKTPLVLALARLLAARGEKPALLTRGFGRKRETAQPIAVDLNRHQAADVGDEALLLARAALTIVGADRLASAALAQRRGATCLILDDGFHSRRVAADLALLAIDADYGAGNGRCLPAGPLRAPLDAQFTAADMLVVIGDGARGTAIAEGAHKPYARARLVAEPEAAKALKDARVVAFAGVARPEKFFRTVEACGAEIVARAPFGDHHRFTDNDYAALSALRQKFGAHLVTTEKDAARIGARMATLGASTLPVTLAFDDVGALDAALARLNRAS
ncbi:tetraacyldisaccharide 4'-kinase [Methylocystis sp. 9N]|uniref:Tetraacyldisaccharide 4'-kinase n=1 Tax=Methylocystis borbori TaxID=3118750 RepID=A0ABU7XJ07_9HYPH